MRTLERWLPLIFIILAFLITGFSVYIASQRELTELENTLLQTFALLFGLLGSFLFGRQSAREAAQEIIRPHARSAFRRLISLYESLSRVAFVIESSRNNKENHCEKVALAKLEAIVIEQLATADDALEDWRDIVPNEVAELTKKLVTLRGQENLNE